MTKEDLLRVFNRLLVIYDPETALKWLQGTNAHLGNRRPIDVLADGDYQAVHAAIDVEMGGGYA